MKSSIKWIGRSGKANITREKASRRFIRQMVQLAINLGVAKLAELCIDGARVLANASRFKTLTAAQVERLLAELDQQIAEAMSEWATNDQLDDLFDDGQAADRLPPELRDMKARQEELQAALAQLQEMDLRRKYKGRNPQENPAQLPTTDDDSRILPNKEGDYAPNDTPMAMTETENGFIVGAHVLADSIFATGQNLTAMANRGQAFLSPPLNKVVADNPADRKDLTQAVSEKDLDRLPNPSPNQTLRQTGLRLRRRDRLLLLSRRQTLASCRYGES